MKSYYLPTWYWRKKWVWFDAPHDVDDADMVTFFSYDDTAPEGFSKKKGATSVINLARDEAELWNQMREKFIRTQIRKGERNGIRVYESGDFGVFKSMYLEFRNRKKLPPDDFSLFEKHGLLLIAENDDGMLAGGVFLHDDAVMRAWVLASGRFADDNRRRELAGQANRMVIWEAIRIAKKKGLNLFDLGGIDVSPEDANSPLTIFKEAFGGRRVENYYYTKVYSKSLQAFLSLRSLLHI